MKFSFGFGPSESETLGRKEVKGKETENNRIVPSKF